MKLGYTTEIKNGQFYLGLVNLKNPEKVVLLQVEQEEAVKILAIFEELGIKLVAYLTKEQFEEKGK